MDILLAEKDVSLVMGDEEIEKSSSLPETLVKTISHDYIGQEVLFVCVRAYDKEVVKDMPNLRICGKKMIDWVLLAGSGCKQVVIDDSDDIIGKIRSLQSDKQTIAVFYSDTPLLDRATFQKIIDYFYSKGMNYLQLSRGFIIKSEYLKNNLEFVQGSSNDYDEKGLLRVDSAKKINYVDSVLRKNINNFHIKNGVIIFAENTVSIDADVEIESGVVIYPNNVIKGSSIIESGAIIESGNIICDSIISSNAVLANCYIERSKISGQIKNSKVINEEK